MNNTPVYLASYTLQSDSRIRLPKSAITNLNAIPGKTRFSFYYDNINDVIIMRVYHPQKEIIGISNTNDCEGNKNG